MKTLLMREFIGLNVKVDDAKNKAVIGTEGKVVDETKNTFKIQTKKGVKSVVKANTTFIFEIDNKKIKIDGNLITKRPEDRLKLKVK